MIKNKIVIFVLLIGVIAAVAIFFIGTRKSENNFEARRERVLSQLYSAIEQSEKEGKYQCCIEPPCTMCYLGNWVWQDGACYCDEMIAKDEWDKVCPQCVKGIEEGRCKSKAGTCPII